MSRQPLDQLSDEDLVARYRSDGSALAVQELVRRHERSIYLFVLRFVGERTAAEDATQEVFVRMVQHLRTWDGRAQFRTWLFRVARNHCIDAHRKSKLRQTESLDAPSDPDGKGTRLDTVPSPHAGPEAQMTGAQVKALLLQGIQKLSPEQREVLLLRQEAGLSFKEIAEMTQVSENTVKSRMRYALEHLRSLLEREGAL